MASYNGLHIYDSNAPASAVPPMLVNAYSILTIPAYWRAINFLSNNLASFPRAVYKDGTAAPTSHPLNKLLARKPNGYQNATSFWRTLLFHTCHQGNGYAAIEWDGTGFRPLALHHKCTEDMSPFRYINDAGEIHQYYYNRPEKKVYHSTDIVHLMGLGWDGQVGLNPVTLHAATHTRASLLDRFMTRFLMKGTIVRGAIEVPTGVPQERIDEMVGIIRGYFQGVDADRDLLMLSDGAKLNNATLSPEASQIIEQGAYTTKQISQITGVPPAFLYDLSEGKYNSSVEQAGLDVVRYTFRPIIEAMEDELSLKLLADSAQDAGFTVHVDPNALVRGDTAALTTAAVSQKTAGLISTNEGRAIVGYPKSNDPEDDKIKTLGDIGATGKLPAIVAPPPVTPPKQNAALGSSELFAALAPVISAACSRVDTKTNKAFETHGKKPDAERTIWCNVFAEGEKQYVTSTLGPVSEALVALGGDPLDVTKIADRYAASLRKRAATGESKSLQDLLNER